MMYNAWWCHIEPANQDFVLPYSIDVVLIFFIDWDRGGSDVADDKFCTQEATVHSMKHEYYDDITT